MKSLMPLVFALALSGLAGGGSSLYAIDAEIKARITETRNCKACKLAGADLTAFDLQHVSFAGADLRGAKLTGRNLYRVDFKGANLAAADLSGANLSEADFSEANLVGARLKEDRKSVV